MININNINNTINTALWSNTTITIIHMTLAPVTKKSTPPVEESPHLSLSSSTKCWRRHKRMVMNILYRGNRMDDALSSTSPRNSLSCFPHYFKLSKIASFQRQLNLYGFQRLTRGRDRGGYYHELFLRGSMFLAHNIHRIKVKGTGVRARSNPEQEPNFWEMPWISDDNNKNNSCSESSPQQQQHQQQMVKLANTVVQSISSMGQLPPLQPEDHHPAVARLHYDPFLQNELDLVSSFGKSFHYLDPYEPMSAMEQPKWSVSDAELLQNEAETFFEDFDFPEHIGAEIEDDVVFGDMLESLIS
jgi:hypothetical protein